MRSILDFRFWILDFGFPGIANRKSKIANALRLASCVLCLVSLLAWDVLAQNWYSVQVVPGRWDGVEFNDVCFVGNQGWAVGEDGTIIHTHTGARWHDQISGVSADLNGIHFDNTREGWAVGNNGTILRTRDGGITWVPQQVGSEDLYDVHFIDSRRGWAVGEQGVILRTDNGGYTWTPGRFGTENFHAVYFYDINNAWVVGEQGTIFYWDGNKWEQRQSNVTEHLYGVHFTSRTYGWIVGEDGTVLHTSDGLFWTIWTKVTTSDLRSIHFPYEQYGWIVGDNGTILHTNDSGGSWWTQSGPVGSELNAVYGLSVDEIWAVGDSGSIIHSTNRGGYWVRFVNPAYGDFRDVSFGSSLEGWLVGDDGVLLRTEDGGESWREQSSPIDSDLYGVYFINKYGWAVGDAGAILRTVDGVTWELEELTPGRRLRGVHLSDVNNGWAVGDDGTILHWDSGAWRVQDSPTTRDLYGVYSINNADAWAVGDDGTVLHTTNGGVIWEMAPSNTYRRLRGVYFADSSNGWIVGDDGLILHRHGGEFTTQYSTPTTGSDLYDVDFVSINEGWISGADGIAISTRNGGDKWDLHLVTLARGDLYGIDFTDWGTGIAVGENSTVVRYISTIPTVQIELISPYGNIATLTPTFRWRSTRPDLIHRIFIDDDDNPFHEWMHAISMSDNTSFTLDESQSLTPGIYYWGIELEDGTRATPSHLQFTVWPPTEVTLISPSGYISESSPIFQWDCNNKELGSVVYTLFIGDDDNPYDGANTFANIFVGRDLRHTLSPSDPLPTLPEGKYTWGVRTSGPDSVESDVLEFIVDLSPPTGGVAINDGAEFTNSLTATLTLSASDPIATGDAGSGVKWMQLSNDGETWSDPESWAGTEAAPLQTKTWDLSQYGGDPQDGLKTVYVRYVDGMGHQMTTPASDDITLDTVLPTGTVLINDGAEVTGSADVVLSLSASDDRSGVEVGGKVVLSNDGNTWSSPLPYEASRSWNLTVYGGSKEEGVKTVYAKYVDAAGNMMTQPASDDIRLDLTGPTGTISINDGAQLTKSLLVKLTVSAFDESGVQSMQFTNGGGNWSPLEPYSTERENWDLSQYGGNPEDGKKTVYARFVDSVENVTVPAASDDITLKSVVSVSVQIFSPKIEGKIKNNDVVRVDGSSDPGGALVAMDVLDESGKPLDIDLTGITYEAEAGWITGSFNVGELTVKTIQLKLTVKDDVGNQGDAASNILTVDNEPPGNTSVSIDQGELINSTSIDLTISATDVLEMYVHGDVEGLIPTKVGAPRMWIPYADALKARLTDGDGTKEVRVKFRDDMENETAEVAAQTLLDATPPTGTVVINNGGEFTESFLVTLALSAADDNGVESYRLSNDGGIWSDELQVTGDVETRHAVSLQIDEWDLRQYGGDNSQGPRAVYVKYMDEAGNWSDPVFDDIHVDATAPTISVQLVKDEQEAMEPVTITAIIKDNRAVTEASLHYRRKGPHEYTAVPMTKLPGDYYTAEIPGLEVTLIGVEYYVSASDGLSVTTHPLEDAPIAPNSFPVVDTTRPDIEHDPVGEAAVKSSPKIAAIVTDAVEVMRVSLFHKLASDRHFTRIDMVAEAENDYSASIPALDELGVVEYYIEAVDSSSNSRTLPERGAREPFTISFADTEPPVIVHTKIADGQEAGEPVVIGATITDNMAIEKVLLKYKTTAKRESVEVEMASVGSYYSAEIPGTVVMPGTIDYSITASDGSPQSEDAEVLHSFTVVDTTPPAIELTLAPSQVEVHNNISIEVKVTDNVKVQNVNLYYKGVGDAEFSMLDMAGVGNRYSAAIPGQEQTGEVKYYIYAEDSHGVSSTEPPVDPENAPSVITVIDVSGPVIEHSPVVGVQEAGRPVTITATVTDNVQVGDVSLHYRIAGQGAFELVSMVETGEGEVRPYYGSIPESVVIPPGVEYYIKAIDNSSNVTTHPAVSPDTLPHSFPVADTAPPDIVYDPSGLETALITEPIVVTVEATDLTGIKEVRVFYRGEGETSFSPRICQDIGDSKFSATIPSPPSKGTIYYYIQVEDNSGNKATSPEEDPTGQPHSVFVEDPFPPLPPTQLAASSAPGGKIILTWELSTSPDTDKYNIYTDSGSGTVDYSAVYDSVDSATSKWESPVLGEGVYKLVVRTVDRSENEEGNTAAVSAEADATKPERVTNLVATSQPGGRIQLEWMLSVSRDAHVYNIYWDNAQASINYSSSLARVNDPLDSWTSDGLRDGVVYRFVVRCQDYAGNEEENTDFVSAKADAMPPGNVTGLLSPSHRVDVWSNQAQVTVRWNPAEDAGTGLAGYSVSWDTSERTLPDEVMDIGNEVTVTAALSGSQYFHIRPVDEAGNWGIAASHLGPFLIDTQPPEPPTNLNAAPQAGGKVRLDWEISTSTDVVRYNIYWDNGTGRGVDYTEPLGTVVAGSTSALTWTSPGLEDGRTYEFGVRAEDQAGNEEKNTQKSVAVADSQPPTIVHTPIVGLLEQEIVDVPIEATVTDASALAQVELHYRKRGETSYTDVEMVETRHAVSLQAVNPLTAEITSSETRHAVSLQAANLFTAEIPSSAFSSAGVDYYISASDEAGNVSEHPIMTIAVGVTLSIPIDASSENNLLFGDGVSLHFPAGAVATDTDLNVTVPTPVPEPQTGLRGHILTREFGIADAQLGKSITLTFRYSDAEVAGEDESKLAVYLWNGQRWDHESNVDPEENSVTVKTMKLGVFSIIGDYDPPIVMDLRPAGYAEPDVRVTAEVEDSGSGVHPELYLQLDGQSIEVPGTALKDTGTLEFVFPEKLEQGHYSLKLTVRDNVENQATATSRFQVVGELTLRDVFCYPNPFQPTRGVHFAYTLTESVNNVTIRIFGMDGKLVREMDGTTSVGENVVPWDGKDEEGEQVLSSVYICHIEAEGPQETVVETIKIAGWE